MKTFIAIGSLVVLALVAVLLAPFFVDWTAYRAGFEREASRLLGQPVVVRGEASARLLPFPSLTFTDVAIGETAGGEPRLTLARFGLDAELAPYLSGEIRIFQMRLEEPHLRLAIGPGGLAEWPGTGSAPAGASSVVFEDIEVTDGRVTVETGSAGRTYELSGIDAEFSASSLAGPYGGGGTLQAEGAPLRFSLSSGVVEEAGTVPFRVSVESDALDALLAFDGTAQLAGGQPDIRGAFQLASPLERPEPAPGGAPRPASPLPPVRVTAAVAASPTLAALSEMRVEVGGGEAPYVLNGEGSVDYGTGNRFSLTLSGEQVDVDTIGAEEGRPSTSATFADRVEAVRQTLAAIPPVRMPGEVKLTLPIVTAGDTTIRNVSVDGAPSPEGWDLGSFSAELPGRTLLEASGGLLVGEEDLGFRGDVLLASRQPPSFAGWLTGRVEPALNSVDRAGFSAHVDLGPGTQILDDLEVDVGGETLFGRLERSGIPGERLVAVELGGDAADLDRFAAFLRLFVDGTDALEAPDRLELRFAAGPVTYAGIRAERLEADFSYDRSLLDIRRFSATGFAGTDVGIQGTVADVAGDPQPDIAVQISSPAPQRFLDFLRTRFPDTPILVGLGQAGERLGPLLLSGNAASDVAEGVPALKVRMTGSAAGTEVELALALENGLAAARESGRFGLDLALRNERPAVLLGQFGFEGIDVAVPAPLELEVALSGSETGPIVTAAAARAPGTEVYADGMLDLSEAGIEGVDLAVRLGSDDVAPWLLASGLGYASIDILPADLSAGLSWFKGDWALSDVTGSVAGSTLGAQLQATRNGSVTGAAALSELSLPWLATLVYGVPPALSDGASAENVFGVSFMPEKPFSVDLTAARLGLGEAGAIEGFVGRIDGDAQSVRLSDAAGRFAGGRLSGSAEMQNLSGFGSLRLDLAADGLVLPQPEETGLGGTLSGTMRVESGAQTYSALAASLTGEGEAVLREGHLFGVAPDLFQPILGAAEAEGFEATSAAVAALVERLGEGSAFPLGTLSTPVNVGAGVARFGPVVAERERERLSIAGALDLEEASVEAAATLSFDPGEDALEASAPSITYRFSGPLGEPRLVADVESLTGYLSARAAEREAARLEALREDLRETLRLRREARFYQARQETRERLEAERLAVEEAERQRLEREAGEAREREEAAREAERQRAEEAEAAARAAEEAEASARAEREPPPLPEPSPPPAEAQPPAGFDGPIGVGRAEPPREYEGLPGVGNPIEF